MLARAVAPERVIGAVVYSSNDLVAPGEVLNHSAGRNMLVIGESDDRQTPRIAELRALLTDAGLHSPAAPDIRQAVWDKLLLNFGSTLCVPIGEPIGALAEDARLDALRERLSAEGRAIAHAHGRAPGRRAAAPGRRPADLGRDAAQALDAARLRTRPADGSGGDPGDALRLRALGRRRRAGAEALTAVTARLAARKGLYSPP